MRRSLQTEQIQILVLDSVRWMFADGVFYDLCGLIPWLSGEFFWLTVLCIDYVFVKCFRKLFLDPTHKLLLARRRLLLAFTRSVSTLPGSGSLFSPPLHQILTFLSKKSPKIFQSARRKKKTNKLTKFSSNKKKEVREEIVNS